MREEHFENRRELGQGEETPEQGYDGGKEDQKEQLGPEVVRRRSQL